MLFVIDCTAVAHVWSPLKNDLSFALPLASLDVSTTPLIILPASSTVVLKLLQLDVKLPLVLTSSTIITFCSISVAFTAPPWLVILTGDTVNPTTLSKAAPLASCNVKLFSVTEPTKKKSPLSIPAGGLDEVHLIASPVDNPCNGT